MFGVSFLEIAVIGLIALIVVGPQKLPGMMRTIGEWMGKLRRLTSDMRAQTGIDDILREEGIDGVAELRTLLRGGVASRAVSHSPSMGFSRYSEAPDASLEFPVEGADAAGALPEDLFKDVLKDEVPLTDTSSESASSPDVASEEVVGTPPTP